MLWSNLQRDLWNWSPWREMRRLQDEMDRLFQSYWPRVSRAQFPPLNMYANDDQVVVTCELPGVDAKDIDVSVLDDTLTLKCSRQGEELKEGEQLHRQERPQGEFVRTVTLPYRVDSENVEASYRNGVLRIALSRSAEDKPKRIEVQSQ